MIRKIEHIGIAVKDLSAGDLLFTKLLGRPPYKSEEVESERVKTSFFMVGETKVELLEAGDDTSAIAKYIEKRGEGIHHIALHVDDIRAEMKRLKAEGFELLSEEPKTGADGKLICFLHPRGTHGVLVELCQDG